MINLTLFEFNYGWLHKTWVCTVEFPCEGLNDPVFVILGARVKVKLLRLSLQAKNKVTEGRFSYRPTFKTGGFSSIMHSVHASFSFNHANLTICFGAVCSLKNKNNSRIITYVFRKEYGLYRMSWNCYDYKHSYYPWTWDKKVSELWKQRKPLIYSFCLSSTVLITIELC